MRNRVNRHYCCLPAGLPLSDTVLAGSYAVVSGHDAASINWAAFQHIPTLVVLMGGRQLGVIAEKLQETGWPADTPVRRAARLAALPVAPSTLLDACGCPRWLCCSTEYVYASGHAETPTLHEIAIS